VTPYAVFGGACVVPKGGNTLITLKADITTYGDGGQAGEYVDFYITVPSPITGATADAIVARGAGDYASTTAPTASSSVDRVYPYRTSLTSALACSGSCTGRTRSATDKVAVLTLTGTNSADAKLRVALNIEDDTVPAGAATGTSGATYVGTTFGLGSTAARALDGALSITLTASTTATASERLWTAWPITTELVANYSKVSVWYYPTISATTTLFISSTTTDAYATNTIASTTTAAPVAAKWNYLELDVPAGSASTSYAVGIAVVATLNTAPVWNIDAFKAYNDSITVDISGNATDAGTAYPVSLKTIGGSEKALGYFDYTNLRAVLVPTSEISIGATPVALEMITDTTKVIAAAVSGISRTLTLSIDLGSVDVAGTLTAGDFRWNDQAVAATTPITWMNGASPISVTLSLATGN